MIFCAPIETKLSLFLLRKSQKIWKKRQKKSYDSSSGWNVVLWLLSPNWSDATAKNQPVSLEQQHTASVGPIRSTAAGKISTRFSDSLLQFNSREMVGRQADWRECNSSLTWGPWNSSLRAEKAVREFTVLRQTQHAKLRDDGTTPATSGLPVPAGATVNRLCKKWFKHCLGQHLWNLTAG